MICVRREVLKEKLDLSVSQRSHRSLVHGGFTATGSLLIWLHVDMFQYIWWFLADSKWSELLVPGAQNWEFLLRQLIKSWVWCKCHCLKSYCLPSFSHLGPCSLLKPHITKLHMFQKDFWFRMVWAQQTLLNTGVKVCHWRILLSPRNEYRVTLVSESVAPDQAYWSLMASRNLLTKEVVAAYIACVVGVAFVGCKADVVRELPSLVPPCELQSRQIIYKSSMHFKHNYKDTVYL